MATKEAVQARDSRSAARRAGQFFGAAETPAFFAPRIQRKCAACRAAEEAGRTALCPACAAPPVPVIQRQPVVGPAEDDFEREADRVADEVVRRRPIDDLVTAPPEIRRLPDSAGGAVAAQAAGPSRSAGAARAADAVASGGRSLSRSERSFFEPRFGRDLGHVRVHDGAVAGHAAQAIGAKAYTLGRDIAFAPGQYSPTSPDGQSLMAHEIAHTFQQESGQTIRRVPTESGIRGDRYDFSRKCGWIDWSHASPGQSRNLIDRVNAASASLSAGGSGEMTSFDMQSAPGGLVLSSANVTVRLLRPLTNSEEAVEVALAIFKELSMAFETQQRWTDLVGRSSFSQEDLPSNLIAFYMAARGFARPDIEGICGVVSNEAAHAKYDRDSDFVQNRTWSAIGAPEAWPDRLSDIDDSQARQLFEITSIQVQAAGTATRLCPEYRVVGTIGATDFLVVSLGGTRFTAANDVRVVPTYRTRSATHGAYGHTTLIEVEPKRPQDRTAFADNGQMWPVWVPQPVLQCLTSHGNAP